MYPGLALKPNGISIEKSIKIKNIINILTK
jgi:hypothetical protein